MPLPGEPQWQQFDRDIVTAWQLEQAALCPCGCGGRSVDTFARKNQYAYEAQVIRCFRRAAMDRAREEYEKQDGADTAGLMTQVSKGPGIG